MSKKAEETKPGREAVAAAKVIVPDPPPTVPSPPKASRELEVDPVIVQLQAENTKLVARVAELEAFLRDAVHVGLNFTKAHNVLYGK